MEESVVFTIPFQTYRNHASELSTFGHVISEWYLKGTFNFTDIMNNFGMSNCKIYFPLFSEIIHTILKTFSQHVLRKCR